MVKKIIWIVLFVVVLACNKKDKCDDSDLGVNFDIFLNLSTESGESFLSGDDFDISKLKIFDQELNFEVQDFEVIERDNLKLLKLSPSNQKDIAITFEGKLISSFQISIVSTSTNENCVVEIDRYNITSNQELICKCNSGQIIFLMVSM